MRPVLMVIDPPCFDLLPGIVERAEHVGIQAFIAKPAVKPLHHRILYGFPRSDAIELHAMRIGPGIERLGREFPAIVHGDYRRLPLPLRRPLQGSHDLRPRESKIRLD